MQQNSAILIAAAFTMIGFALGRVTAPAPPMAPHPDHGMLHMEWVSDGGYEDIQVIVKKLEGEGFQGDTVMTIPGGEVRMIRNGDEIDVEVEMEEAQDGATAGENVVVRKQVIMVTSDED